MLWKQLSEESKAPFQREYDENKKKYDEAISKFYAKHPEELPKKKHKS